MKLKLVKPSQGVVWVRQGVLVCRRQMLGYIGLVGLLGLLAFTLLPLPGQVGALIFVGVMPVIWMGFMLATRRVLTGQRITPTVLFEALKGADAPRRDFAVLGVVYIVATLVIQQLAGWLGPDAEMLEKAIRNSQESATLGDDPIVLQSMLWRLGLTLPITLAFWHTPALLLWGKVPVAKALFFSAVATWRNIGAFIMYGLTWLGLILVIGLVSSFLLALLPIPVLANMLAAVASMLLAGAFYASLYFSVIDCFEPQHTEQPPVPPTPPDLTQE
jgi:hypothetical protein